MLRKTQSRLVTEFRHALPYRDVVQVGPTPYELLAKERQPLCSCLAPGSGKRSGPVRDFTAGFFSIHPGDEGSRRHRHIR